MEISMEMRKQLEGLQQAEIIGHYTYQKIAAAQPQSENREVLEKISRDEMNHSLIWKKYTGRDVFTHFSAGCSVSPSQSN